MVHLFKGVSGRHRRHENVSRASDRSEFGNVDKGWGVRGSLTDAKHCSCHKADEHVDGVYGRHCGRDHPSGKAPLQVWVRSNVEKPQKCHPFCTGTSFKFLEPPTELRPSVPVSI